MLFFNVTESLFNRVIEALKQAMNIISPFIGSISVVLLVIVMLGLVGSKSKKKYISDNFILVITIICIEMFISVFFFNTLIIKINLFALCICILVLVLNAKKKKKKLIVKEEQ